MSRTTTAYLGLGSNLGDRAGHLRSCEAHLHERGVRRLRASSLYASQYVGPGDPQPDYLNAVLEVSTTHDAWALLDVAQEIERLQGRDPETHMQPRPLDIDLLFFGDLICVSPRLTLPHPRLDERRFVLEPLAELGVLERLPWPGLRDRLEALRGAQQVTRLGPWEAAEEVHGIRT